MKVICTILARGGSTGVKNKNIKPLLGKPLIEYTIEQAIESKEFYKIAVNSDSDDILNVASKYPEVELVKRPKKFANDTISKRPAIRQSVNEIEEKYSINFDIVVDLDCTSPLRDTRDISNSLKQFKSDNNDNLITAMDARRSPYFNMVEVTKKNEVKLVKELESAITCRQDAPKCYDMNASIYIWKKNILFGTESNYLKDKTGLYIMPEERSIDIDTEVDFKIVEFFLKGKSVNK